MAKAKIQGRSFVELSKVLTGEQRLNEELGKEYFERIQREFGDDLNSLLGKFDTIPSDADRLEVLEKEILVDEKLGVVAGEITMLWYMAGFQVAIPGETDNDGNQKFKQRGPETPEQNFQALVWSTIRAHPLGLSGGYFGYWHYPPEN